jgi:hypothetical protein
VPEIPEDALHAAARALRTYHGPDDEPHLSAAMFKGEAAAVVAAVAPILAEHIAARLVCPYNGRTPWPPMRLRGRRPDRTRDVPAHPNAWPPRTPRPESSHDEDLLRLRIP